MDGWPSGRKRSPTHVPWLRVSLACPGSTSEAPTAQAAPSTRCAPKAPARISSLATPFCRERTAPVCTPSRASRMDSVSWVLVVTIT